MVYNDIFTGTAVESRTAGRAAVIDNVVVRAAVCHGIGSVVIDNVVAFVAVVFASRSIGAGVNCVFACIAVNDCGFAVAANVVVARQAVNAVAGVGIACAVNVIVFGSSDDVNS